MRIRNYSHKPKTHFFGDGPWYIGVELEIEAPSCSALNSGMAIRNNPRSIIAKHDGSLGTYGVELVTAPISPSMWLKPLCTIYKSGKHAGKYNGNLKRTNAAGMFLDLVKRMRELGFTSYDSGRCGLHMHVSLAAFEGTDGLKWFRRLIHGDVFAAASQRSTNIDDPIAFRYCHREKNAVWNDSYAQGSRYNALNVTRHTAEVRLFRGNTKESRLRQAIELVIAAVEFAKVIATLGYDGAPTNAGEMDERFIAWVNENAATYPHAAERIRELRTPRI